MTPGRLLPPLALIAAVVLGACRTAPPVAAPIPVEVPARRTQDSFERDQLARARALENSGSYGEAAIVWEILSLYRPDESAYRSALAGARSHALRSADELVANARAAAEAGNEQRAVRESLRALSLDRSNKKAAALLRKLEATRNRRYFLGRPTRETLGRADDYLTEPPPIASPSTNPRQDGDDKTRGGGSPGDGDTDRFQVEQASALIREGAFTEALALLARFVGAHPEDEHARSELGRAWEAFGDDALSGGRLQAALRAFERAQGYQGGKNQNLTEKIEALRRSLGLAS